MIKRTQKAVVRGGLLINLPGLPTTAYLRFVLCTGDGDEDNYFGPIFELSPAEPQVFRLCGVRQWANHALIAVVNLPAAVSRVHAVLVAGTEVDWGLTKVEIWNAVNETRYAHFGLAGRGRCIEAFSLFAEPVESESGVRHTWEVWADADQPTPNLWSPS